MLTDRNESEMVNRTATGTVWSGNLHRPYFLQSLFTMPILTGGIINKQHVQMLKIFYMLYYEI